MNTCISKDKQKGVRVSKVLRTGTLSIQRFCTLPKGMLEVSSNLTCYQPNFWLTTITGTQNQKLSECQFLMSSSKKDMCNKRCAVARKSPGTFWNFMVFEHKGIDIQAALNSNTEKSSWKQPFQLITGGLCFQQQELQQALSAAVALICTFKEDFEPFFAAEMLSFCHILSNSQVCDCLQSSRGPSSLFLFKPFNLEARLP